MFEVAIAVALIALLFSGRPSPGGDVPYPDGSRRWGDEPAPGFRPGTNDLWISPTCDGVAEGRYFFPLAWRTEDTNAVEYATLTATLAHSDDNTALGFIDYLVGMGEARPEEIARWMLLEASPMCATVPQSAWSPAMREWYASLISRIRDYTTQDTIG